MNQQYNVWVFDSSGNKAAFLQNAFNITRKTTLNEPPVLEFYLPGDDSKSSLLTSSHHIKIYNNETGQFEGFYDISSTTLRWGDDGSTLFVECIGILARLAKSGNISYDSTSTPQTPNAIITGLLALQDTTNPITVGTIEPTTTFSFSIENDNILKAILKCVEYIGGYIEVDSSGKFNWYNIPSGNVTREIRYKKNLKGITRKIDYAGIYNRIYAYGFGEGTAQITLLDAGLSVEYVEDTASQAEYGVSTKRITDKRIKHPSTLLRWANAVLAELKDPRYYYSIDIVNLAANSDYSYDLEYLSIPSVVRVVNEDISISVDVVVVGLTENLSEPHNISVELDTILNDLSDTFANVRDSTHLTENQDVQIGAGQVTVQGTFTVDGWRTTGSTTIDGGNITTNTLSVNAITSSTLSNGQVITIGSGSGGTLRSYNYYPGAAGWQIDGNGNAEFNSITIYGYIPNGGAANDVNTHTTTITGTKITTGTITADQIAAGTITANKIAARTITADKIETGTITGNELAFYTIQSYNINSYAITANKIASGAITADKIQAGAITTDKLNFSVVEPDNVIASINASTEGITINASRIEINGVIGYGDALYSRNYGYSSGWRIDGYGNAEFNQVLVRGTIKSGGLLATSYGSSKLRIFPDYDTALEVIDYYGNTTFKCYVGASSNWGDVVIGRYESGLNGCYWDNSAGTFKIRGTLLTTKLDAGEKLTVYGDIESQNFDVGAETGWRLSGSGSLTASNIDAMGDVMADRITARNTLYIPSYGSGGDRSIFAASSGGIYYLGVYLNGAYRYVNLS